jgi:hypothetical protein
MFYSFCFKWICPAGRLPFEVVSDILALSAHAEDPAGRFVSRGPPGHADKPARFAISTDIDNRGTEAMLRQRLNDALKDTLKAKDQIGVATVRLILAALKDRDIAARGKGNKEGISEDEILGLLQSMIKQRQESIALYEKGGRCELAEQERGEIAVIERFLPKQMGEAEMVQAVREAISETGAQTLKDMGKIMAALKSRYAGQMDFAKASALVKQTLA